MEKANELVGLVVVLIQLLELRSKQNLLDI